VQILKKRRISSRFRLSLKTTLSNTRWRYWQVIGLAGSSPDRVPPRIVALGKLLPHVCLYYQAV